MRYRAFNLNDIIKAKLLPEGLAIHKANYIRVMQPLLDEYPYRELTADKDGYIEFQAWNFMGIFGAYIGCGMSKICQTEILIKETK